MSCSVSKSLASEAVQCRSSAARISRAVTGSVRGVRQLHGELVHITPAPVLPGLDRGDDRVACRVEMLRAVLILRIVATADVTAGPAEPKVNPGVTQLEPLFAAARAGQRRLDRAEVTAPSFHTSLP